MQTYVEEEFGELGLRSNYDKNDESAVVPEAFLSSAGSWNDVKANALIDDNLISRNTFTRPIVML